MDRPKKEQETKQSLMKGFHEALKAQENEASQSQGLPVTGYDREKKHPI